MNAIPTFAGPPLVGLNLHLLNDPVGLFTRAQRRYGDLVELDLGAAGPLYGVFHPDGVKQVLLRGRRTHRALLRELLGGGLFTSPSGEDWLRRRRLSQPVFTQDRLSRMLPLLLRSVDETVHRRWRPGLRVDAAAEMKRLTVAMMVDATFGPDTRVDRALARRALGYLLPYVDQQLFTLLTPPRSWPTLRNRHFRAARAALRGIIAEAVRERRAGGTDEPTFLNGLLEGRSATGGPEFTGEELVDEVLSIFIAGTETTGTALTWALHLLSTHPAAADALRAEVAAQVGTRTPTPDDLSRLHWPRAIVREAVRLYPPAWALRRVMDEPLQLGGATVPAGSPLIVSSYVTHRHPGLWTDPEDFVPSRWLPSAPEPPRFAYFPFGAGAHQCAGQMFALLQGELLLTRLAQEFTALPTTRAPVRTSATIALSPVPTPELLLVAAPIREEECL